jgi:rhodanese-related sulfurtransferase
MAELAEYPDVAEKTGFINSETLAHWLDDEDEIALVDVREAGRFGEGHAILAVNVPYSRLELDIARLVPRTGTRTVLIAEDDAGAAKAVSALEAAGYTHVHTLSGGTAAWRDAGNLILQGVNVPSKAFAEFVELVYHTPDIQPAELVALQRSGADLVLLDSRTVEEYRRFHVPGAISCPGSELVYRFNDLVPSADTLVVISCAGRTRGVMGAQTLINAGVPNRVMALSGGTQGWKLAGLPLTSVNEGEFLDASDAARAAAAGRAASLLQPFGIPVIDAEQLAGWQAQDDQTTYLFDVRTEAEYLAGHFPGAVWAQGVQLIQCLDQWAAVRKAKLVLTDNDGTRAIVTAHWLRQLGWDACVLRDAGEGFTATGHPPVSSPRLQQVPYVDAATAAAKIRHGALLVDAGSSAEYRRLHPAGALWANRSALSALKPHLESAAEVIVFGEDDKVAQLLALDLAGSAAVSVLRGGLAAWVAASLPTEATPGVPADKDRLDFLFWLHDRHEGNAAASAAYLEWEAQLPATLGAPGLAGFRFPS